MRSSRTLNILILLLMGISSQGLHAKVRLFNSEAIIKATLEMDISYFREHKEELRNNGVPGKLIIDGKPFDVEILSRGYGSLDNIHPPFKLIFKKKQNIGTLFEDIKKVKAFSSYDGISQDGENQVLSNFLTYKLVELITPYSFKTRMFSIKYVDTSGVIETFETRTFLKEPNKNIAKRLKMTHVPFNILGENDPIAMNINSKIHMPSTELMTAFEFVAGNWDHAIPGIYSDFFQGLASAEKNMKMLRDDNDTYYPIAYDFDMSGFIDRGICWWEIGYGMMNPGRADHFQNVKEGCDTPIVRRHLEVDLKNYFYKNNVIKHFPYIKKTIIKWQNENSQYLKTLSPKYLINLNDYLSSIQFVIQNHK